VFILAALVAGNMIVKRLWPGRELSPGELLVAYVMVAIATSMGTTTWDGMTSLPTILTYPFRFATPANRWAERMLPILPQWAMVSDPAVVTGFWEGRMSPYSREVLAAWWRPALWWTAFLVTMVWVGLCLCSLVRRRWSEEERLAFPMTILPLAMTSRDGSLWRSRGFQWGAAVTSAVALLNLAHSLVPSVPGIPFGFYHGQYTVHLSPWSGIRQPYFWYPPFLIGISYLMPLDLLFSLWVFTVIGKLQQVAAIQLGWNTQTWWGPPYIDAQIWGALFAIMATVFWLERRYLWAVVRGAVSPRSSPVDQGEAMSHRAALAGVVLGSVYLCVFLTRIGVEPAPACGFVALLLSVSLALARLRAQLGPPHHELPGQDAVYYWITRLGSNARTPAGFTLLGSYTRSYRDSPTAITVEGLKMGERERSLRGLGAPIVLAAAIGCLSLFWANIQLHYTNGADNNGGSWKTPPGFVLNLYASLDARTAGAAGATDWWRLLAMGVGAVACAVLMWVKLSFPNFPLHPAALPLSTGGAIEGDFAGVFIAWVIKAAVLRWGGQVAYRASLPIALGVITGDAVTHAVIAAVRPLLGR
jgi:hypothetical protein